MRLFAISCMLMLTNQWIPLESRASDLWGTHKTDTSFNMLKLKWELGDNPVQSYGDLVVFISNTAESSGVSKTGSGPFLDMLFYPNPDSRQLVIYIEIEESADIKIFTSLGEGIATRMIREGKSTIELDLNMLPSDEYVLRTTSLDGGLLREDKVLLIRNKEL